MGVYIKGMEMPTERESFNLTIKYNGVVLDTETGTQVAEAHELSPHGRLGDLDELNEKHDKLSRDFCHGYFKSTWDFVCAARKLFYDAPTIIPAEEGE